MPRGRTLNGKPEKQKDRDQRYREWLKKNPHLWDKHPKLIVQAMKEAGLVAKATFWEDVRSLRRLIPEVKTIHRGSNGKHDLHL